MPGRKETEEIGLVSAADVRSKNVLKDVMAALGGILGGETTYYSHLLNEASQAAMDKMGASARSRMSQCPISCSHSLATSVQFITLRASARTLSST